MATNDPYCRVCGAATIELGQKQSVYSQRCYAIRHCVTCRFSFVANPWTEFERIYSAEYYAGRGADRSVDYLFELEHPRETVRTYEWAGILEAVESLVQVQPTTRWLDFGCGNGGLVRYVREHANCQIVGFDQGWIRDTAAAAGIPYLDKAELDAHRESFDIVTGIEVLEHIIDPLEALRQVRSLLKTGGLFFFTTGNAQPYRQRLLSWPYLLPDIHVSFFEPQTMARALRRTGFEPEFRGFSAGFSDIIRFKVLKDLRLRRRSIFERMLPWPLLARVVDASRAVTAHPIGWAAPSASDDASAAAARVQPDTGGDILQA